MPDEMIYHDDRAGCLFDLHNIPFRDSVMKNPEREIAELLSRGYPIGIVSGRSEFGPRALGGRCILADPRPAGMQKYLNDRIKHREWFRPYAPVIRLEKAEVVFKISGESPYMLQVAEVQPEWKARIPAALHVDGTARVQTVTPTQDDFLCGILREFESITSVPVLVLTSFNDHGDPIVESPLDAYNCFASTDLPYLVLGRRLLSKLTLPEPCRA